MGRPDVADWLNRVEQSFQSGSATGGGGSSGNGEQLRGARKEPRWSLKVVWLSGVLPGRKDGGGKQCMSLLLCLARPRSWNHTFPQDEGVGMAMDSEDSEGVLGKHCYFLGLPLPWSSFPVFSTLLSHPELGEAVRSTSYIGNLGGGAPSPFPHSVVLGVGVTPVRKLESSAERTTNLKNIQTNQ